MKLPTNNKILKPVLKLALILSGAFVDSSVFSALEGPPPTNCPTEQSARSAIIFFDFNNNPQEIAAARRGACSRGEYVIVLPPRGGHYSDDALREKLNWAQNRNINITSMVLSGHDGGGAFGGEQGVITRGDLSEVLENFPEIKDQVSSLLLLGCYTGTKSEIYGWKNLFPNANLIGGYEGQAPLGGVRAGHHYLEDLLKRERDLNEAKNAREIESILRDGIRSISMLQAATYFRTSGCVEGQNSDYYFRPLAPRNQRFTEFSSAECERIKREEAPNILNQYLEYFNGSKPISVETGSGTELRRIYNFFRTNEHCFEDDPNFPEVNQVLYTLFFHNVKRNFGEYIEKEKISEGIQLQLNSAKLDFDSRFEDYTAWISMQNDFLKERRNNLKNSLEEEIQDVENRLGQATLGSNEANLLREYSNYLNKRHGNYTRESILEDFNRTISGYEEKLAEAPRLKESLRSQLNNIEMPSREFFGSANRRQILDHSHKITELVNDCPIEVCGFDYRAQDYLYELEHHLVEMDYTPFKWHDYIPGVTSVLD